MKNALDLGFFSIQIWGLMVAVGMLVALLISIGRSKRNKGKAKKGDITSENLFDLFIIVFIFGLIGARLVYGLEHSEIFLGDPYKFVDITVGGLNLYGGIFLAAFVSLLYFKFKKLSFWQGFDIIAPGLALGIGIGRVGDYLVGNHIGARTKFFLGSNYEGDLRHSPSLYFAISNFVIFIILLLAWPFIKRKEGLTAYLFIVLFSVMRFLLEFTRAADIETLSDPRFASLTLSQWFSLVLFVIFLPLLILKFKSKK